MFVVVQELVIGGFVDSLFSYVWMCNFEYVVMQVEVEVFGEWVMLVGVLFDLKFWVELCDIICMGEQSVMFFLSCVGSIKYLLMQDVLWFGKCDLKCEIVGFEVEGVRGWVMGIWVDIVGWIKVSYVQLYYFDCSE